MNCIGVMNGSFSGKPDRRSQRVIFNVTTAELLVAQCHVSSTSSHSSTRLPALRAQHLKLGVGAAICGSIFICAALINSGIRSPANRDE
jgi:hypothetical protein